MEEPTTERIVLVVESNPDQVTLITAILKESPVPCQVISIKEGDQVLAFLQGLPPYHQVPRPDLILLDLDIAGRSGTEILTEIKADAKLKQIPIVVLTLSDNPTDIYQAYTLHGNCYVIKSQDLDQLAQIIQQIEKFWLGIVTLPVK